MPRPGKQALSSLDRPPHAYAPSASAGGAFLFKIFMLFPYSPMVAPVNKHGWKYFKITIDFISDTTYYQ